MARKTCAEYCRVHWVLKKMRTSYHRPLEVACFISIALVIAVGTVYLVIRQSNLYIAETLSRNLVACNVSILTRVSLEPLMGIYTGTVWEKSETDYSAEADDKLWERSPYADPNCRCARKCCPKGYAYDNNLNCIPLETKLFNMYSKKMCPIPYKISPEDVIIENVLYNYTCHGTVSRWFNVLEAEDLKSDSRLSQIDESYFCMEYVNQENAIYIVKCNDLPIWFFNLRVCGHAISALFSVISIILYSLQPALHNLHGKAIMSYMACLLIAQVTIPIYESDTFTNYPIACTVLAFFLQISSLASAFWLNILCFDIWWVFSGITQRQLQSKDIQWTMFFIYSCYAWGGTVLITTIATIMDLLPNASPYYIRPKFGYLDCWFNDKYARVLYYELPIGVLLCLNLLMFMTTAYRIRNSKVGASRRGSREKSQRFILFLKLFLVMGLYWCIDIVSPLLGKHRHLWIVPNILATLQGLFVFIFVICNRRTSQYIRNRLSTTQSSSV